MTTDGDGWSLLVYLGVWCQCPWRCGVAFPGGGASVLGGGAGVPTGRLRFPLKIRVRPAGLGSRRSGHDLKQTLSTQPPTPCLNSRRLFRRRFRIQGPPGLII